MSAELQDHAAPTSHAFDSPEEVAHARKHARQNFGIFIVFFSLILLAVFNYEFYGVKNIWVILLLAATRVAWIAFFFAWLFGHFSYVIRTFVFTIVFLMGMIFLSMFDSDLPILWANPIKQNMAPNQTLFQPKPLPPAKP